MDDYYRQFNWIAYDLMIRQIIGLVNAPMLLVDSPRLANIRLG